MLTRTCSALSGTLGYLLSSMTILWCSYAASSIFASVLHLSHQRVLVGYPVALLYSAFALVRPSLCMRAPALTPPVARSSSAERLVNSPYPYEMHIYPLALPKSFTLSVCMHSSCCPAMTATKPHPATLASLSAVYAVVTSSVPPVDALLDQLLCFSVRDPAQPASLDAWLEPLRVDAEADDDARVAYHRVRRQVRSTRLACPACAHSPTTDPAPQERRR